jgi:lysophospholipid acyltransferase (LPLAT)-like uncharacterized protein
MIQGLGLLGAWVIRGWMSTLRYRFSFPDSRVHPTDARVEPYIYAFWHETLFFPAAFKARVHVLTSHSAEGELMSQICRHLGMRVIRGSSTHGGSQALVDLLRRCRNSHLALTPDGPLGPRRQVKLGAIFLASQMGLPIVPLGVGYSRAWRAGSWDRLAVPHPWSTAACVAAPAICIPARLDRNGLEHYRRRVETELTRATDAAERWVQRGAG